MVLAWPDLEPESFRFGNGPFEGIHGRKPDFAPSAQARVKAVRAGCLAQPNRPAEGPGYRRNRAGQGLY